MSILIKGMEMPTSCGFCLFETHTDDGYECSINGCLTEYQKRPDDCPLVPVPPHGDLIERNELLMRRFAGVVGETEMYIRGWNTALEAAAENAPTIIPASEEADT